MSQSPDYFRNPPTDQNRSDDHLSAVCASLQLHLTEPTEEVQQLRWCAVNHPDTDPQVLHHIASRGSYHLQKRVAEHPRAGDDTLDKLARHDHYEVRAALAENQNIPTDLQWSLAQDQHPDVRFALAQCYHIDQGVLISLLEDDNPFVAHRARVTLQRKSAAANSPTRLPGSSEGSGNARRLRASG